MKVTLPNGLKARTRYAGFRDNEKVTAWYRSREQAYNKTRQIMRTWPASDIFKWSVRPQLFAEPPPEQKPVEAAA
jgi:hypothetical protein